MTRPDSARSHKRRHARAYTRLSAAAMTITRHVGLTNSAATNATPLAYADHLPRPPKRQTAARSVKVSAGVSGTASRARICAGEKRNSASVTSAGSEPTAGLARQKSKKPLVARLETDNMR